MLLSKRFILCVMILMITIFGGECIGRGGDVDAIVAVPANAFVTTWKTDNVGITDNNQIKIGTIEDGYDYQVDWGDGSVDSDVAGDITHTYAAAGTYTIAISGDFPQIYFGLSGYDNKKLLSVEQWSDIQWQSMSQAFYQCNNLVINALDVPDLSEVTDMSLMFAGASHFNQDIGGWDVSEVTNMKSMFSHASDFNQDISGWNVSAVTNMSQMFRNTLSFDQDIGAWDVSAVTNMSWMFSYAGDFNRDISSWDVSVVTNMSRMFGGARDFNQNISSWNVSAVTNMSLMFKEVRLSTTNYDALLSGWSVQNLQSGVVFDGGNSQYSSFSQDARDTLTGAFNWRITDGRVVR